MNIKVLLKKSMSHSFTPIPTQVIEFEQTEMGTTMIIQCDNYIVDGNTLII